MKCRICGKNLIGFDLDVCFVCANGLSPESLKLVSITGEINNNTNLSIPPVSMQEIRQEIKEKKP